MSDQQSTCSHVVIKLGSQAKGLRIDEILGILDLICAPEDESALLPSALEDDSVVAMFLEYFDHLLGVHLLQERVEGVGAHTHQDLLCLCSAHYLFV